MIVSIHQPAYLPWLGYFDRIAKSDLFIVLDNVQLERRGFTHRNKIKTPNGPIWLTVPLRLEQHFTKTIADVQIEDTSNWRQKHLRSVQHSYAKAQEFGAKFARLEIAYRSSTNSLLTFCMDQLQFWMQELSLTTRLRYASDLRPEGRRSDLILNLCKQVGATTYLSGPLGRDYLDEAAFKRSAIVVRYHDFEHPIYPQLHGPFLPRMGIVDYWMNVEAPDLYFARARELSA